MMEAIQGIQGIQDIFDFSIGFLMKCQIIKKWVKYPGDYAETCGYTGPGIGLILQLFKFNGITDDATLNVFLSKHQISLECFMHSINETIGNFLDVVRVNPVTNTMYGINGMIKENIGKIANSDGAASSDSMDVETPHDIVKVSLVDNTNLVEGANVISFIRDVIRDGVTFFNVPLHHATLYVIADIGMCVIIDSWRAANGQCRPLTYRMHNFEEVKRALIKLNSKEVSEAEILYIFTQFFVSPEALKEDIRTKQSFNIKVYLVDAEYMKDVYITCETSIKTGSQTESNFGGFIRKKKMCKTKKLHKKTNIRRKKTHTRIYMRTKKLHTRRRVANKRNVF